MNKYTFLLILLMFTGLCQAQEEVPVFPTDRPGYTNGAEVLPLHKVSWENGFSYESSPDGSWTWTLNSMIVRYGIFQNMELRIGTDFQWFKDGPATNPSFGIAPLSIGTKIKVYESSNWLPSIGLMAEFKSPHIGSKDLCPSHIAPSVYALFEHDINDWFWLGYNAGLEWDGESVAPQTFLSIVFGFNITDNIGALVDFYNYLHPEGDHQFMSEIGLFWTVSPRVQIDLECDLDFKQFGKYYSVGGGISWMIN